jgi:hypothetical protein
MKYDKIANERPCGRYFNREEHDEKAQSAAQSIASTDVVDEKGDIGLATSNTYPLKIQLDLGETRIRSRTSWWKIWYVYKLCINQHSL